MRGRTESKLIDPARLRKTPRGQVATDGGAAGIRVRRAEQHMCRAVDFRREGQARTGGDANGLETQPAVTTAKGTAAQRYPRTQPKARPSSE